MLIEALSLVFGYLAFCYVSLYTYAVVKSYEILGFWNFKAKDGYVGVCKLPKWMLLG